MNDNFKFNLDVDIEKSGQGQEERRFIKGYASNSTTDRQDESLVQKGLDISDFVNHGYFNYDHDNSIILGYPLPTCRVDERGFYVEGELLKGIPMADKIWELAKALKKSNAPRKVGFSVEGKVVKRNGNKIEKAKIYNVAITTNPVNPTCTWDAVVKSFNTNTSSIDKSLMAGHETNPDSMEGGEVFQKESLETSLKNLSYVIDNEDKKKKLKEELTQKSLSARETILYLQLTKGWSYDKCKDFMGGIL